MSAESNRPDAPAAAAVLSDHDALPPGTRFGEFEIIRVLGVGGFGIVYLAHDHSLERQVALKEYMPAALAARGDGPLITVRSGSFAETYAIGLRSFVNEARLLARFDHPSLVKVYRFWEDNATAYMVMPYLQGITLRDARRAMAHAPDEAWLRSVLDPMLDALEQLHREGVFHRDIAPDNILLPPVGAPVLLDFGAARRVISDRTQSLTAILKPSYAPIEQYADMTAMRQGPWTDLYALGAVMHFLLFGVPPPPATARALQGDAGQIEQRVVPGVSPRFLAVVAWMLGVRPLERPQSVAALRAVLKGDAPIPPQARPGVTGSGNTAPEPVASRKVPFSEAAFDSAFEPTMLMDRVHALPTQLDTGYRPTERMAPLPAASLPAIPLAPGRSSAAVPVAPAAGPATDSSGRQPVRRRGVLGAFVATGVVAAALVLWQFVGLLGASRVSRVAADPAGSVASAAVGAAASGVASGVQSRAGEASSAAKPAASPLVVDSPDAEIMGSVAPAASPPVGSRVASVSAAAESRPKQISRPNSVRTTDLAASMAARAAVPAAADEAKARSAAAPSTGAATQVPRPAPVAAPIGPATAREACAGRAFIALAVCMDRECEQPQFRDSPECVRVLNVKRQRAER
jgi:serine/threonine protein kinase